MLRVVEKRTKENEELRTTLDELPRRGPLKMSHEGLEAEGRSAFGGTESRGMTADGPKWCRTAKRPDARS
jgi:hypothetical protein